MVPGLAGNTALKAVTDAAAVAKENCLLILTVKNIFARLHFVWFGKPLDVGKRLEHVLINFL